METVVNTDTLSTIQKGLRTVLVSGKKQLRNIRLGLLCTRSQVGKEEDVPSFDPAS
jgi:hypothetical protein